MAFDFEDSKTGENIDFLTTQLITYLGNKRTLIFEIEKQIEIIKQKLNKNKIVCADLFSGSGIVARMLKKHSSLIIANDLENYSYLINSCYLTNKQDFNQKKYTEIYQVIQEHFNQNKIEGIIAQNYAPKDDQNIQKNERVFYSRENALRIDTYRKLIDDFASADMQKFFLAPLITESSVHTNTSGVFKGFYKDKTTGIGCFGGSAKNSLTRILGKIQLLEPIFSNFESDVKLYQKDAVLLAQELKNLDVVYLDPPYNQHPYGSNYFMLNLIIKNKIDCHISQVSGILSDWNRSDFNKQKLALLSLEKIISAIDSRFVIVSYNSEGFISFDQMKEMLMQFGKIETIEIKYNTFRGSRNLNARNIHVKEYLFILQKH